MSKQPAWLVDRPSAAGSDVDHVGTAETWSYTAP